VTRDRSYTLGGVTRPGPVPRARGGRGVQARARRRVSGADTYVIHSRGLVMVAGLAAIGVFIGWRHAAARLSVLVAALTAVVVAAAGWALNHHISLAVYPEGTRSLSGQIRERLGSVNGIIHVLEMAAGQLWRVVLDSWGIAGIGLVAALLVIVRRDVRSDLRIMGALTVAVTTLIACMAPAALPSDQPQAWASGRYLDGMIVVFFLVGAAVLLRARMRDIVACAGVCTGLFLLAARTCATRPCRGQAYRRLHAHLASGVGADGLLAAAGRLVSFGRQWCAAHGVPEPEFNLGGGMHARGQGARPAVRGHRGGRLDIAVAAARRSR
jgi:hypothetical protein